MIWALAASIGLNLVLAAGIVGYAIGRRPEAVDDGPVADANGDMLPMTPDVDVAEERRRRRPPVGFMRRGPRVRC